MGGSYIQTPVFLLEANDAVRRPPGSSGKDTEWPSVQDQAGIGARCPLRDPTPKTWFAGQAPLPSSLGLSASSLTALGHLILSGLISQTANQAPDPRALFPACKPLGPCYGRGLAARGRPCAAAGP